MNQHSSFTITAGPAYQHILVDRQGANTNVGVITLNRPKALNALCDALMRELNNALDEFEKDKNIAAVVITGSEKAFAAGNKTFSVSYNKIYIILFSSRC